MTNTTTKEIYQLRSGFYIEPKTTELGEYFVYSDYEDTDDPNRLDPAIMCHFGGKPQHKIPNRLWNQMVTFFMHYLEQGTEVECRYYKRGAEFVCVVGNQTVAGPSVTYNYALPLYGLDGIRYTRESLVADSWILYAHFHLHPFDMPSPSSVDDKNEMKTPLLYGIISIPTGRKSNMDYRIRTTVVAHNGDQNYRYFPQAWDFIELPVDSELQTYTHVGYAPICESQVKRFVYIPQPIKKFTTGKVGTTKWLQPSYTMPSQPKSLTEKLLKALEGVLMSDYQLTVADLEKELPVVLSALLDDKVNSSYTYDNQNTDPFYFCDY